MIWSNIAATLAAAIFGFGATYAILRFLGALRRDGAEKAYIEGDRRPGEKWSNQLLFGLGAFYCKRFAPHMQREYDTLVARSGRYKSVSGLQVIGASLAYATFGVLTCGMLGWGAFGIVGAVLGTLFGLMFFMIPKMSFTSAADTRVRRLRGDLPFGLDLLALCLRGQGSLTDAIRSLIKSNKEAPLAEEFEGVLTEMEFGRETSQAFSEMGERLSLVEFDNLVTSIIQGEQLGTPLAETFENQAMVARHRRYENAERAANEASVKMAGPTMLVMFGVLLLLLMPSIFNFMDSSVF